MRMRIRRCIRAFGDAHGCEVLLFECSQNISVPSRPLNSYEAYFNFIISRRIFRSSNLSDKESLGWAFSEAPFIIQNNLILFNSAHPAAAGARTGAPSATGSTQFRRGARAGAGMVRVFVEIRRKSTEFGVKCVEFSGKRSETPGKSRSKLQFPGVSDILPYAPHTQYSTLPRSCQPLNFRRTTPPPRRGDGRGANPPAGGTPAARAAQRAEGRATRGRTPPGGGASPRAAAGRGAGLCGAGGTLPAARTGGAPSRRLPIPC